MININLQTVRSTFIYLSPFLVVQSQGTTTGRPAQSTSAWRVHQSRTRSTGTCWGTSGRGASLWVTWRRPWRKETTARRTAACQVEHRSCVTDGRSTRLNNWSRSALSLKTHSLSVTAGSAGVPPTILPFSQSWESAVGNREGTENGGAGRGGRGGGAGGAGGGGQLPENWELAFSDSGEPYYIKWVVMLIIDPLQISIISWFPTSPRIHSDCRCVCIRLMMMMMVMVMMMMVMVMKVMMRMVMMMMSLFQSSLKDDQLAGSSNSEQRDNSLYRTWVWSIIWLIYSLSAVS